MTLELTFELEMKSNFHIGAGYGKGFELDSVLLREADGALVIRGSSLAGLLRGGLHRLLELEPLKERHSLQNILNRVFGSTEEPKRWSISSAYPVDRWPQDSRRLRRVRIDPRTRRAEPRKLFSQEEGLAGQKFQFSITFPSNDAAALDDAACLVAAARFVRQIGRSRRRGFGECVIRLVDARGVSETKTEEQSWQDWFLARFEKSWLRGEPAPVAQTKVRLATLTSLPEASGTPVRIRVIVRLEEPLLLAERASAGNQFDTRPFIPGSVILGALANAVAERSNLAEEEIYRDFVRIFRRGAVSFSALYPAHEHNYVLYPTIPAPQGLVTCSVFPWHGRSSGHGFWSAGESKTCPICESRLEPVKGFIVLKQSFPYTLIPTTSTELHIRINDKTQRVEKGQLYGYTVLDAGQYFIGEFLCSDEATWDRLQELAGIEERKPLTWRIGKARRRGYGKVSVWLERCEADSPPTWIGLPLGDRVTDHSEPISMTLLTDAIVLDSWGRQATGFTEEWLQVVLGLGPVCIEQAYARTRVVDGFYSHLGLPRWRDVALSAGSVVWFHLKRPPKDWKERLAELEQNGIGLRRNEGFGRVAFNHPIYARREALSSTDIPLDRAFRPKRETLTDMLSEWEETVDRFLQGEKKGKELDPRFDGLARWLHAHAHLPLEKLLQRLTDVSRRETAFGEPDADLIQQIGKQEYGNRSKDNFFAQEEKSRDNIANALKELKELLGTDQGPQWQRGVQILADRIAALAQKGDERS